MDRQSTIGFILIFVILVVWMWVNSPQPKQQPKEQAKKQEQIKDSTVIQAKNLENVSTSHEINTFGKFFTGCEKGKEKIITIETDLYRAELTSKGGLLRKWELKKFVNWNGQPVQLISDNKGELAVILTTTDGRVVNTKDLYFDVYTTKEQIKVEGNFEFEILFTLTTSNGGKLEKTMKFKNGEYGFEQSIQLKNFGAIIANYQYEVSWENGIPYAEYNSVDESGFATAHAFTADELMSIDATKAGEKVQKEYTGSIDWIATCNKYFAVAIIPMTNASEGAYLEGSCKSAPNEGLVETYGMWLKMPYKGSLNESITYKIFLGPLQHSDLKSYGKGLENIMSLGWAWLVRPISEYIMLPVFTAIHYIVPNWGLVIIIFSILIKIVLHPLSKSQMTSMKKMQKLQPLMDELREKYKNDQQKMNQSIMNLYKEYGINPAGGCLPLLLQLPIMYALYSVFRGAIELRQASFIWWINDLSIPDVIYKLPAKLPLIGIQEISGIALLMGITMFVQTKMTTKDPRQKAMVWIMPIMMTFLFNGFPAGLNLYYAIFNILSIGQQVLINKKHDDEPLRKVEVKKKNRGGIFKFTKDMPRLKK